MILYLLAGFLGLVFMTLSKMSSVRKDFDAAGQPFVLKKFLRDELIGLLMSVTFIAIMAITVNEWASFSPTVNKYVICLFAMGGAIGSWAFQLFLGKSKKYIRTVIDIKTNVVDNQIGKTETITELKKKAADAGMDITKPQN